MNCTVSSQVFGSESGMYDSKCKMIQREILPQQLYRSLTWLFKYLNFTRVFVIRTYFQVSTLSIVYNPIYTQLAASRHMISFKLKTRRQVSNSRAWYVSLLLLFTNFDDYSSVVARLLPITFPYDISHNTVTINRLGHTAFSRVMK